METGRIKNGNIRTAAGRYRQRAGAIPGKAENISGFSDIEYINSARWWIFYAEE